MSAFRANLKTEKMIYLTFPILSGTVIFRGVFYFGGEVKESGVLREKNRQTAVF